MTDTDTQPVLSEVEARLEATRTQLLSTRSQILRDHDSLQDAIHELDEDEASMICEFLNAHTVIFDEFEVDREFGVTVEVQMTVRARSEADAMEIVEMNFDVESRGDWDVDSINITCGNY